MADLSKIKVSNTVYNIKDAQARADLLTLLGSHALEALKDAAWLDDLNSLDNLPAADEGKLPNAKAVKDYVDSMIETIPEFDVVVVSGDLPTASKDTFHKIYLQAATSPAQPNLYKEWITIRSGTDPNYTYSWELIGDTSMDLSTYVQKTTTIAGVDLQDNITKAELQTALDLKDLAYSDTASETLDDYVTDITGASYTPAGTISVDTITQTSTAATLTTAAYTPSGTITGTNAASAVTFTGNTNTNVLTGVDAAAVLPTFTEGAFTAATITKNNVTVATEGVTATVGTGEDAETLIINAASTDTATNVTAFDGGSKAADTFTAGSAATFTTDTAIKTLGTGEAAAQTFTGTFTGTEVADALVTGVDYDKATAAAATFTGTAATITPTLTKGSKTITVTGD